MSPAAARPGDDVSRAASLSKVRCPACHAVLEERPSTILVSVRVLHSQADVSGKGTVRRCWRASCRAWLEVQHTAAAA